MLGGKVEAPTIDGRVALTIPKGASTGRVLRLRGKGVRRGDKRGDQLVTLKIVAPPTIDAELDGLLRGMAQDPRLRPAQGGSAMTTTTTRIYSETEVVARVRGLTVPASAPSSPPTASARPRPRAASPSPRPTSPASQLLEELVEDFDLDEDAASMVVALVDQIHGLRHALRRLGEASPRSTPRSAPASPDAIAPALGPRLGPRRPLRREGLHDDADHHQPDAGDAEQQLDEVRRIEVLGHRPPRQDHPERGRSAG